MDSKISYSLVILINIFTLVIYPFQKEKISNEEEIFSKYKNEISDAAKLVDISP